MLPLVIRRSVAALDSNRLQLCISFTKRDEGVVCHAVNDAHEN
jgi:hypothetical protein